MLSPGELVTGHQKLNNDCFACHAPFGGIDNQRCITCHKLDEIGRDSSGLNAGKPKLLFHQKLASQSCTACHTDHDGMNPEQPLSGFKHTLLSETVINNCVSCHQKPADKLHDQLSSTCKSCHQTDGWKSDVVFNHNMLTDKENCVSCHLKPTDNLHKQVTNSCNSCHNTEGWKSSVVFNHDMLVGADKNNCAACHAKPADSYHASLKDNCSKCHSTDKWVPSTFDHSAYFSLDGDHNASCNTCHKSNQYNVYTCYGCHEHTVNNILSEHREEGISNINDCVRCHKSGSDHEGGGDGEGGGERSGSKKKKSKKEHDDD